MIKSLIRITFRKETPSYTCVSRTNIDDRMNFSSNDVINGADDDVEIAMEIDLNDLLLLSASNEDPFWTDEQLLLLKGFSPNAFLIMGLIVSALLASNGREFGLLIGLRVELLMEQSSLFSLGPYTISSYIEKQLTRLFKHTLSFICSYLFFVLI